jgi:hypothetical protein
MVWLYVAESNSRLNGLVAAALWAEEKKSHITHRARRFGNAFGGKYLRESDLRISITLVGRKKRGVRLRIF